MGWVRIDDNAPQHIKMLTAGPHACWLWVCGLAYCQRQKTNGFIPSVALPTLGVGAWKKYAGVLVSAGLWHKVEEGYQIHDYLDWNASAEEREEKAQALRERVNKHRDRHGSNATVTRYSERGVTPLPSPPLHLHSHSTPTPTASRAAAPLVMSPLQYERLQEKNAFVGARLRIPHVLHGELRNKLGGDNPESRLQAWYSTLDEEAERTREPIPDVFAWVRPKFVELAQGASNDAVKAAFMKATGGSRGQ
jgi:hypothetical protein